MENEERCDICFFLRVTDDGEFQCRKNPPVAKKINGEWEGIFPPVIYDSWCGSFGPIIKK